MKDLVLYFDTCPTPVHLNNEYRGRAWFDLQPWRINVSQVPTTEYVNMPVQIGAIIGWYIYSGPSVYMCMESQGFSQRWELTVLKWDDDLEIMINRIKMKVNLGDNTRKYIWNHYFLYRHFVWCLRQWNLKRNLCKPILSIY